MWFGSLTAPSPPSMTWTLSTTARLAIFNNNTQENKGVYTNKAHKYPSSKDQLELAHYHSEITLFDLATGSFTPLLGRPCPMRAS